MRSFIYFLSFSLSFQALASDFQSPRTSALGGAGHAGPILTDAIYQNPSYIAMMPVLALGLNYLTYPQSGVEASPAGTGNNLNTYNISAQNGLRDAWFQYGIGYTQGGPSSSIHFVLSKSYSDQFFLGMGTKITTPNQGTRSRFVDGSVSASGIVTDWFRFSLTIDNLIESGQVNGFNREYTLGTKINLLSVVQLYLDPLWVPTLTSGQSTWGYELGAEYPFLEYFFLRTGIFKNASIPYRGTRGDGFGLGLGLAMPHTSLDYAYTAVLNPAAAFAHHFALTVYF